MADTKISALTAATTPLAGTEVLPIVQSSTTKKVAVSDLTAGRAVSALSLTLTGSPLGVGSGGTGTSTTFTAGSVVFAGASGVYSQNNSKLFWDNTNNRLGIGTASPTQQLHVSGGLSKLDYDGTMMYLQQTTDTPQQACHRFTTLDQYVYVATFIGSNSGNDQRLIVQGRGGEMAVFGQYGRSGYTSPISGYVGTILADNTTFNKAMYWDTSGNVTLPNGNIVQGTAAKGINFTANTYAAGMTSQLLNWYEEGSWTPTVSSTGGGAATYVRQIGRYTRIGNRVFFQITMDLATKGTLAAGDVSLTGLPYTSNSTVANWSAAAPGICDGFTYPAGADQLEAIVAYNGTTVDLYWMKSGSSTVTVKVADISATARINFSGHYMV